MEDFLNNNISGATNSDNRNLGRGLQSLIPPKSSAQTPLDQPSVVANPVIANSYVPPAF